MTKNRRDYAKAMVRALADTIMDAGGLPRGTTVDLGYFRSREHADHAGLGMREGDLWVLVGRKSTPAAYQVFTARNREDETDFDGISEMIAAIYTASVAMREADTPCN